MIFIAFSYSFSSRQAVHPLLYLSGSGAGGLAVLLSSTRQDLHLVSYADMITDSESPATTFNMAAQDVMVFLHIQKTGGDEASLLSSSVPDP
jgi:hypothetical protein